MKWSDGPWRGVIGSWASFVSLLTLSYIQCLNPVRSLSLDTWTAQQVKYMELGGNKRARSYFGLGDADVALGEKEERWSSPEADKYRAMLHAEVTASLGLVDEQQTKHELDPALQKYKNATAIGSSNFGYQPKTKSYDCISTCCIIL
eukprot:TRINITY_DN14154_c0_g1_i1.p1 TRINITY_DN14154_c0_g1~~TRINITY_DN14154_c0_g1_i1.p1  ORF type:complete len:147 (+),score=23.90 TRINITY_DN14154_c0_g1_i1:80-520(+)